MFIVGCILNIKINVGKDEVKKVFIVKVLDIYRYVVDKSFFILDLNFFDVFDIVISDGCYKMKCLLLIFLNCFVYEYKLWKNFIVMVSECSCLIDEKLLE